MYIVYICMYIRVYRVSQNIRDYLYRILSNILFMASETLDILFIDTLFFYVNFHNQ